MIDHDGRKRKLCWSIFCSLQVGGLKESGNNGCLVRYRRGVFAFEREIHLRLIDLLLLSDLDEDDEVDACPGSSSRNYSKY